MSGISINTALENSHVRAEMHIATTKTLTLTDADTDYQITDVIDGVTQFFTLLNGTLTYTGTKDCVVLFTGTSDASISNVTNNPRVTYTLFKNDIAVDGCVTPVDYRVLDRIRNFSVTQSFTISYGDTLKVKAQCSEAGRTLTLRSFSVTFWGR